MNWNTLTLVLHEHTILNPFGKNPISPGRILVGMRLGATVGTAWMLAAAWNAVSAG